MQINDPISHTDGVNDFSASAKQRQNSWQNLQRECADSDLSAHGLFSAPCKKVTFLSSCQSKNTFSLSPCSFSCPAHLVCQKILFLPTRTQETLNTNAASRAHMFLKTTIPSSVLTSTEPFKVYVLWVFTKLISGILGNWFVFRDTEPTLPVQPWQGEGQYIINFSVNALASVTYAQLQPIVGLEKNVKPQDKE